jgi:hypothetical protein
MKSHLVPHLKSHLVSHLNSHLSCHCHSSISTAAKLQTKALYRERVYERQGAVVVFAAKQRSPAMAEPESKPSIETRLDGLDARLNFAGGQQRNILSALSMILDTLRAQGKMLQQLTALARDEPASSPLVQSLDDLTTAITTMDGNLQGMVVQLDGLPKAIRAELAETREAVAQGKD